MAVGDEPILKPIPDPASYPLRELIEEMETTYKERDEFISGKLQLKKISVEMANLQRYRLGRLIAIARLLKAIPGLNAVTGYRESTGYSMGYEQPVGKLDGIDDDIGYKTKTSLVNEIPLEVYYSDGKFFDATTLKDMGTKFFAAWATRREEFPGPGAIDFKRLAADVASAVGPNEGTVRVSDSLPSASLPRSPNVDYDEVERLLQEKLAAEPISDVEAERLDDEKQFALQAEIDNEIAAETPKPEDEVEW